LAERQTQKDRAAKKENDTASTATNKTEEVKALQIAQSESIGALLGSCTPKGNEQDSTTVTKQQNAENKGRLRNRNSVGKEGGHS